MNYSLAKAKNDTDGAFSLPVNNFDPGAEWGPAQTDVRHRVSGMFNMNLWKGFKLATSFSGNSAPPYNITTGHDDNNDTVSNDRPAGVGRNAARASDRWDVGARLSYAFGFGRRPGADGAGGPQIIMIRGGGVDTPMGGFSGGADDKPLARRALPRGDERPQPHQPHGLQRCDDVAVLRRADVGGPGAQAGGGSALRVLSWGRRGRRTGFTTEERSERRRTERTAVEDRAGKPVAIVLVVRSSPRCRRGLRYRTPAWPASACDQLA